MKKFPTYNSCLGKSRVTFGSSRISLTDMSPPRPEWNLYVVMYGLLNRGTRLGCVIFWFLRNKMSSLNLLAVFFLPPLYYWQWLWSLLTDGRGHLCAGLTMRGCGPGWAPRLLLRWPGGDRHKPSSSAIMWVQLQSHLPFMRGNYSGHKWIKKNTWAWQVLERGDRWAQGCLGHGESLPHVLDTNSDLKCLVVFNESDRWLTWLSVTDALCSRLKLTVLRKLGLLLF